jgi:hypothetical protein
MKRMELSIVVVAVALAGFARADDALVSAVLNIDQTSLVLSGPDWDPGYSKASCDTLTTTWSISVNSNGTLHSVLCGSPIGTTVVGSGPVVVSQVGPYHFYTANGQNNQTMLINDLVDHRSGLVSGDWDPGYYKDECKPFLVPIVKASAVLGISQNSAGAVHELLCGDVQSSPVSTFDDNHCFPGTLGNGSWSRDTGGDINKQYDFALGYSKATCGNGYDIAGVSHDASGHIHRLLCCGNHL